MRLAKVVIAPSALVRVAKFAFPAHSTILNTA